MTAPMMQRPEIVMPTGMQGSIPASTPVRPQDPNILYARQADPRQYGNPPTMGGFGGYGGFGGGYGPMMGGYGGYGGFGGFGGFNPMMGGYGGFGGFGGFNPMMGGLGGLDGYGMFGGRFNPQMGGRFGFGRQPVQQPMPNYAPVDPGYSTSRNQPPPSELLPVPPPRPIFPDRFEPPPPPPSVDITDYKKLYGEPQAAIQQTGTTGGSGSLGGMFSGLGAFKPQFPQYQYQPSIEPNPSVDVTDYRKLFGGFL